MASFLGDDMSQYVPDEGRSERKLPLPGFPEDSWGDSLKAEADNAMRRWGRGLGSVAERLGSGDSLMQRDLVASAQTAQRGGDASESRSVFSRTFNGPISRFMRDKISRGKLMREATTGGLPKAASEAVIRGDYDAAEQLIGQQGVNRNPVTAPMEDKLAEYGRGVHQYYDDEIIANQPNVPQGGAKDVVGDVIEHGVGTVLPTAGYALSSLAMRRAPVGQAASLPKMWPTGVPPDVPAPDPLTPKNGAPYPDGTKLRRGGVMYEVVNGTPVPLE